MISSGKDKSYLINFAIRMLCEAGGPDGLFQQKVKATMMESIGFNNAEGLIDFIDARISVLAGLEPGALVQDGGRLLISSDLISISRTVPQVAKDTKELPRTVRTQADAIPSALRFILGELENGTEPLLDHAASLVGMDKHTLSMLLSKMGVNTARARRGGVRGVYILEDQLPAVKQALDMT